MIGTVPMQVDFSRRTYLWATSLFNMRAWSVFLCFWLLLVRSASLFGQVVELDSTVVIRSVHLAGNIRTRDRIVLRELEIRPGDTIRVADLPGKLSWDQRKLNNTNLFITVSVSARKTADSLSIKAGPTPVEVDVVMKERWYVLAYPVFDLADRFA